MGRYAGPVAGAGLRPTCWHLSELASGLHTERQDHAQRSRAKVSEELSALPAAELAARLAEAYRLIGELTAQIERLPARVE